MLGAIIGDIVGSRFEFNENNHKSKEFNLFGGEDYLVYNLGANGNKFHQSCCLTDDSIMTIAIGMALESCKGDFSNLSDQAVKFMKAMGNQYPNVGYGNMFMDWILGLTNGPYNSYGRIEMKKTANMLFL